MTPSSLVIQLTPLQASHLAVALQSHMQTLLDRAESQPEGGEHEDYLIAQSILKLLQSAQSAAESSG